MYLRNNDAGSVQKWTGSFAMNIMQNVFLLLINYFFLYSNGYISGISIVNESAKVIGEMEKDDKDNSF
jgi:hypothetical protein